MRMHTLTLTPLMRKNVAPVGRPSDARLQKQNSPHLLGMGINACFDVDNYE